MNKYYGGKPMNVELIVKSLLDRVTDLEEAREVAEANDLIECGVYSCTFSVSSECTDSRILMVSPNLDWYVFDEDGTMVGGSNLGDDLDEINNLYQNIKPIRIGT